MVSKADGFFTVHKKIKKINLVTVGMSTEIFLCIKMIVKRQRGSPVIYLFHGRQSEIIVLVNKNRKKTDYKTHEFSLGGLNVKAWICY